VALAIIFMHYIAGAIPFLRTMQQLNFIAVFLKNITSVIVIMRFVFHFMEKFWETKKGDQNLQINWILIFGCKKNLSMLQSAIKNTSQI